MGFLPLERAVMEANHAQFGGAGLLPPEPATANRAAVEQLQMLGGRLVPFRGRLYLAGPIPYLVGEEHQRLLGEMDIAGNGGGGDVPALIDRMLRMLHRHLRPVRWWGTLPWWCRRNSFRAASIRELGELNALFLIARTT
jgi:hypothetical protein